MKSFDQMIASHVTEAVTLTVNSKVPVHETFPLHPAQNEVFRAQLIDVEGPYYNVGAYVKLKGKLNKEKFIESIGSAPKVFDAFKMRFHVVEAEVVGFLEENFDTMEIAELDFSNVPEGERKAKEWMKRRYNVAFVIQKEKKLFQNVLIKIAEDEHWFFMRYHHLIMDGYGFKVWLQYLSKKYHLLTADDDTQLIYPSYLNEISKANAYKSTLDYTLESLYWKERIADKPKKYLEKKYFNKGHLKASSFYYHLQEGQRSLLLNLQAETGSSLQQLTIAALLIYFGKTTGLSQFILGILLHKRDSKQMRNVVGMFSSILPFKGIFQPNIKLTDFLKELRVAQKKDYRHKNYLSGNISRHLHLNPSEENLCDIVVNHELLNFELNFCNELVATVVQLSSERELLPLQICWQEFGNQQPLQLQIIFREDYFTQKEIQLLTQRLLFIIEQFPLKFEEEIGNIDIIPKEERQLLHAFNNTKTDYPTQNNIIDLFELQVKKTPNKVAVVFKESKLTYQQLNEKANKLAHYLQKEGVKEGTLVPVCIVRSLEMIIGVLAILKAGATYVPIDPVYPPERIYHIIKDTGAKIIITSNSSQSSLPALEHVSRIIIDKYWPLIEEQPSINLNLKVSPTSLVYIIYTSGSTGKPKGVQMPGANLVNLLMWQHQQFKCANRHVLQFASLNFDVSFQEIFSTLCFGSSLYVINEEERSNMPELSSLIFNYDLTHLFLPCIVLKNLAEYIVTNNIHYSKLEKIIVAGEQLQLTNEINQLLQRGGIELINQYGPTEAHVVSSYSIDQHNTSAALPPIGQPIANNQIYILDSQLRLLPIGVTGEICIGGAGVGNGYLGNEELTTKKFVSNPFGHGKLYLTGDIGRWLPDGNLEFLGRRDDQVKIRGHRVELGEIESVLQQCNYVKQCVVIAKENKEGTKQLVCYVVPNKHFEKNAIVSFLEAKLPEYMVPTMYIPIKELPVTINGKVDKNALPSADALMADKYVAPKTVMEKVLVKIWQEVLEIEQVSIQDNFFELGGHSLLVIKMITKINQQTGRNLPPGSLFQHPTVEKYAKFLLEKQPLEKNSHIVTIRAGKSKMPLYIICHLGVAPISRFVPFASLLSDEQPVYGVQLPEVNGLDTKSISIESIASTYVADLIAHNPQGPYAFAGYSLGGIIAVEMAKQLKAMGKKVVFLCLFDTIAYTLKMPQPPMPINEVINKRVELYSKLKSIANDLYYKTDNHLFLMKFNTKNIIWRYKNHLIRTIKKMLNIHLTLDQKTEAKWLGEELHKISIAAYKKYKLAPYEGNITLFRAKKRTFYIADSKYLGWKPYANSVNVYEVEGSHYTMFNSAHCKQMAKLVQKCLDQCNVH